MSDVAHRDDPMVGIRLAAHVDGSRRGFLKDVVEDGSGIPRSPNPLERARRRVGALAFLPDRELGHRCRHVVGGDELDQSGREPVVWECAAPTPPKRALLKPVTTGGGVWRSRLAARRAPLERGLVVAPASDRDSQYCGRGREAEKCCIPEQVSGGIADTKSEHDRSGHHYHEADGGSSPKRGACIAGE